MKALGFGGFLRSGVAEEKLPEIKSCLNFRQKKAQTNAVWADTSIGVNKENAVIKKAGRETSLTAC
ncbi:hypothetical protein [Vibrio splendidus]|jgi:hypothetical protein|uniref:hypothetical protein n=1 Tax=Vibrio splendidus TaxID=29497 RepID=UPI000D3AD8A8|nr:hypothetical protein [Vibrio splendidus]PTO76332.1 hypothetical protein CWN84_13000 [Vibrio splendidus]